jgi:hypothetical protein
MVSEAHKALVTELFLSYNIAIEYTGINRIPS